MPEQNKPEFTLDEVKTAIAGLDVEEQHVVLASLSKQAEQKHADEERAKLTGTIITFAAVYERAAAETASMSNIEGWYEELGSSAEALLEEFEDKMELSEIEVLARDTAAVVYTYLNLEHDDEAVDFELLAEARVDTDWLLKRFQDGLSKYALGKGDDREQVAAWVSSEFTTLSDFSCNLHPLLWRQIVEPLAQQLRAKLIESGVTLPELNEKGQYGDDDGLDLRE